MKRVSFFALLVFLSSQVSGQKTLEEWAELEDKQFSKKWQYINTLQHLKTSVKKDWISPEEIPDMKSVGLFGVVLIQPTFTQKSPFSIYTKFLTPGGTTFMIDKLGPEINKGVKNGFEVKNIELLTPDEFCNTKQKADKFNNTEIEASTLMKSTAAIASFIRSPQGPDDPKGYEGKLILMANSDIKTWREVGQLTKEMGLDGAVVIEQIMYLDGKEIVMGPITYSLIGPNPTPEGDKVSYAPTGPLKGYLEGFIYSSTVVTPPKQYLLATIVKDKKTKSETMEFEDLSPLIKVYSRISSNIIDNAQMELNEIRDR